jgi:predicted metal-dependent phosphoesterase TrpH
VTTNKADIHIHTTYSDGLMTPEAVVEYAATETRLSAIAITDHDTIAGAVAARRYWQRNQRDFGHLDVIIGSEITSRDGDIVGLFLKEDIPAGLSAAETVQTIHAQDGLAIAVHPYAFLLPTIVKGVGGHIHAVDFDGLETRNGTPTEFLSNYLAQRINQRRRLPEVGGSDAHYLPTVGQTYTLFHGRNGADLRRALEKGTVKAEGRVYSWFTLAQVAALSVLGYRATAEPSRVRSLV